MEMKTMLRFVFSGYSIWLEPEQFQSDLDTAIDIASKELDSYPIPEPHVTLVYGMSNLSEVEATKRFRALFSGEILEWPILEHKGFLSDIELDGVQGGLMDMAWMEVTYETSTEHEALLDRVRDWFAGEEDSNDERGPWAPHASLAYANPDLPIPMALLGDLVKSFPSLKRNRRIVGVSLWKTRGTIDQWRCIDRVRFESDRSKE